MIQALSAEPCTLSGKEVLHVLTRSEVIRFRRAERRPLHTGGQTAGTDTTGCSPQVGCCRAGREQVARDPDSQRTADGVVVSPLCEVEAVAGVSPSGLCVWSLSHSRYTKSGVYRSLNHLNW